MARKTETTDLMPDVVTPIAPKTETGDMSGMTPTVIRPEPVPEAAPRLIKIHRLNFGDGSAVDLAPRDCRPHGKVAEQDTTATGVWARDVAGEWYKTEIPGVSKAMSRLLRASTAVEAMAALLKD